MKMVYTESSGKSAPASTYQEETQTIGAKFRFNTVVFTKAKALQLANLSLGACTLDQFISATTTPDAPSALKTCLRKRQKEPALA